MSMQNYPEYGFGLVLTGSDIEKFIAANAGEETEDVFDFVAKCEDKRHDVRCYARNEIDGISCHYIDGSSVENEDMLVIWAYNQPDAFKPAYMDEYGVKAEMRSEFSFPPDFNWKAHIGYFACCVYC